MTMKHLATFFMALITTLFILNFAPAQAATTIDEQKISIDGLNTLEYTGNPLFLNDLVICYEGKTLTEYTDYHVQYLHNTNVGNALLVIFFTGDYRGMTTASFSIVKTEKKTIFKPKPTVYKGLTFRIGKCTYKITAYTNKKKTVRLINCKLKGSVITMPYSVKYKKKRFLLTSYEKNCFKRTKKEVYIRVNKRYYSLLSRGKKKLGNSSAQIFYIGQRIVSSTDSTYSYNDMQQDLVTMKKLYGSNIKLMTLGTTNDYRQVYCIRIGNPKASKQVVVVSSIHAREWYNTQVIMQKIEQYGAMEKKALDKMLDNKCLYIVPMANPDGVTISQYGFSAIRSSTLRKALLKMKGHKDPTLWKANARGVDINRNFPSGFGKNKAKKKAGSHDYCGKKALSEPESLALYNLVNSLSNPIFALTYHEAGQVIYYDYNVDGSLRSIINTYAHTIANITSYMMITGTKDTVKGGGFGDWCCIRKRNTKCCPRNRCVSCTYWHQSVFQSS